MGIKKNMIYHNMTFPTGSGLPEAGSDFSEAGSGLPEAGSGLPEAGSSLSEAGSGLGGRGEGQTNGRTDGQMDRHMHRFLLYSLGHHPLWGRCPKRDITRLFGQRTRKGRNPVHGGNL